MTKTLIAAALVGLCLVAPGQAAAQAKPAAEQKRQLVEQKISLLEMLIKSPAAKSQSSGVSLADKGRRAVDAARAALAENRVDDAARILDEALKSSSVETRRLHAEGKLSEGAQRQTLQNLLEQVATYRVAIADLTKDARLGGAARSLLVRLDGQVAEAGAQQDKGQLAEANRILGAAYKLAVSEIARLRAGQVVVVSLHFETPADEYAYEEKRFQSGEMLVKMTLGEGEAAAQRLPQVNGSLKEGRRLRDDAARLAGEGRHKEAVGLMEEASGHINRALLALGVPVF